MISCIFPYQKEENSYFCRNLLLKYKFWTYYNPQNEKLHRIKTKSCLAENETSPIKLHPTLAQ